MSKTTKIKRRQFLAGAVAAGPALGLASATKAVAQTQARPSVPAKPQTAGDTQPPTASAKIVTEHKVGGDFMVDCLQALDIDYVASCPGSTFRGLQESIINYGMAGPKKKPEFITCLHEEASVAMGHGYAKIAGKPLATMVHGVVGTQHASMAIYNAFCDQTPVVVLAGNVGPGTARRPGVEWSHSAHDQAIIVRDYVKWDDQAANLQDFAEGIVRAYDLATTAPMGPVFCVIDAEQQEEEIEPGRKLFIPNLRKRSQPVGDPNALAEMAKVLVAAENPVIIASRYTRTDAGPKNLVQLAETLGAAVIAGLIVLAWKRNPRLALAVTLAWSTHVLFDWLGSDDTPPLGVMALWPVNSNFYFAHAYVFEAISRRYWLDNFVTHNAWAVIKEVLMLGPLVAIVFAMSARWRGRRRFRRPGTT